LASASLAASLTAKDRPESAATAPARPSVLLVTLDTTRADHTSAYGYDRPTTPRLEQVVRDGVRFEVAYAPMATTLPSHATMFTGLLPRSHGTLKNGLAVDTSLPLLAEVLQKEGYRTAAFLGSFAVASRFGLARGFEVYDDDFRNGECKWEIERWEGHKLEAEFCRRGDLTRARAEKWLAANGYLAREAGSKPPFFLWIHFFDPHNPYDPPPEHARLFPPRGDAPTELDRDIAAYDAEIHFADQEVGKLLDALAAAGRLDDTLVIVAGDHGEGLMDHGWMLHGLQIYEESVRIPFVLRWPARLPRGRSVAGPVELTDLAPTILEVVGASMPASDRRAEGKSLIAAATGKEAPDPRRRVLLQRRFYAVDSERGVPVKGDKHAVRVGRWKYIAAPEENTFELYDLLGDPREQRNLATEKPAERERLAAALAAWLAAPVVAAPPRGVSEEDAKRLEALGYVQ
ncbi:MAG: sulfatase, partial [Thermodesulfobacteriota bacterium]